MVISNRNHYFKAQTFNNNLVNIEDNNGIMINYSSQNRSRTGGYFTNHLDSVPDEIPNTPIEENLECSDIR